jgi:hypothetical protein
MSDTNGTCQCSKNGYFYDVKASLTAKANNGKHGLDKVVQYNAATEVKSRSKTVAVIHRKVGVSGRELLRRLRSVRFSDAERTELTKAMADGAKALTHAGCD